MPVPYQYQLMIMQFSRGVSSHFLRLQLILEQIFMFSLKHRKEHLYSKYILLFEYRLILEEIVTKNFVLKTFFKIVYKQ